MVAITNESMKIVFYIMNSYSKMIFQIESQRDGNTIAQGVTLGKIASLIQALKGRDSFNVSLYLCRPFRAFFTFPILPRVAPWAIILRSVGAW